jgi:hypothetical protein
VILDDQDLQPLPCRHASLTPLSLVRHLVALYVDVNLSGPAIGVQKAILCTGHLILQHPGFHARNFRSLRSREGIEWSSRDGRS